MNSQSGPPETDLAVVGCGPVGAVLAGLTARRGLSVCVFDRSDEVYPLPRAAHFDHEVMRTFQELGIAEALDNCTVTSLGMDFLAADHQVLMSMRPSERTPSGWPGSVMFHQPTLEEHLRQAASGFGAHLRLGQEVTGFTEDAEGVTLNLENGSTHRARFVIGCDGGRSTIRRQVGVELDDLNFEETWIVLDLALAAGVEPPSNVSLQVCDPARPHTLVPMPAPRFRFEFMLLDGDDPDFMLAPKQTQRLLSQWLSPPDYKIERTAAYTFHGVVAKTWRTGRALLAGDAAHQSPPFLGQGMCAGIRDAANLAWKLDRVIRAEASDELLDTYQAEREPQVRSIITTAIEFGRIICTTDPETAAKRDMEMLAAAETTDGPQFVEARLPPLTQGPLIQTGGGRLSIQVSTGGVRLDDLVGQRWSVIVSTREQLSSPGANWWRDFGAVLLCVESEPELAPVLIAARASTVVIRPDRYVFGASDQVPVPDSDLERLLCPSP